jgi:hypothetical protein
MDGSAGGHQLLGAHRREHVLDGFSEDGLRGLHARRDEYVRDNRRLICRLIPSKLIFSSAELNRKALRSGPSESLEAAKDYTETG